MSAERELTVEEFERIAPRLDGPSELVDGRLRVLSPMGLLHGIVSLRVGSALDRYLDAHPAMGEATGAETGFRVDDPRRPIMAPDAAFIRAERLPAAAPGTNNPFARFLQGPPDLAVEVWSPDDTKREMLDKARRWLAVGAREVWLIDPRQETVQIPRPDGQATLSKDDTLTSPDVLPGFSLPLVDLFARRGQAPRS